VASVELYDFWVVILFCFIGVLITNKFKLPSAIGVLLLGALIGPNFIGLVSQTETIEIFSQIGAVLLLFLIGIQFSIEKIKQYLIRAGVIFWIKLGAIFITTYFFALLFGFGVLNSIILGLILSFSSTAIFARIISENPNPQRQENRLVSGILIIEDVFAIFLLMVFSQLQTYNVISLQEIILPIIGSVVFLMLAYGIITKSAEKISKWMDSENQELQIFSALSICALLASICIFFNVSPSIGAFLAGSAFSSISIFKKTESTMHQMILVFSNFFFFSIGMLINIHFLVSFSFVILLLAAINMLFKFLSVSISSYLVGFDTRSALFSASIMVTTSEFALILSLPATIITGFDFISLSASLLFISSIIAVILNKKEATINVYLGPVMESIGEKRLKNLSGYMKGVITRFESGGAFYETLKSNFNSFLKNVFIVLILIAGYLFIKKYGSQFCSTCPVFFGLGTFEIILSLLIAYPIYKMIKIMTMFTSEFTEAFHFIPQEKFYITRRMKADIFFFSFFFVIAILIPFALSSLHLPQFLQAISIIFFTVSFAFIWDLSRLCKTYIDENRQIAKKQIHRKKTGIDISKYLKGIHFAGNEFIERKNRNK